MARWCIFILAGFTGCASYHRVNEDFNRAFERGRLEDALRSLDRHDALADGRTRFLYYTNEGLIRSMMGQYEKSNEFLENAFLFGEDYRIHYVAEAASYFYNPMITVYRGEDHEHLLVLYYKALNYLKMGKNEEALVECRRMNIRLNQLSDRYASDTRYRRDAFVHMLMGVIYQANKDYNNAFIAYRNAVEIYEEDYAPMFGTTTPLQLQKDLLTAAWYTGFTDEFDFYREKFNMPAYRPERPDAELVFFWHNGLGPVKEEWSINFIVTRPSDDRAVFTNNRLGLHFEFPVDSREDRDHIKRVQVFRVAFPKYVERPVYFRKAHLVADGAEYRLERAEDVNGIAFHSLEERMLLEFSKGLLRAAVKKGVEKKIRNDHEGLGAVIGVVNALTEKADTRNWQTLPHEICYTRIPLLVGDNEVSFVLEGLDGREDTHDFTYHADSGQTLFHTFSSLEMLPGPYRYY